VKPVLAIPYLAGQDELRACLASIDADVRLVVIDNSPGSDAWDIVPDDAHVIDMPGNIGYPASINLVIKSLPKEPYWLFANHDVVFAPGDLQRLIGATESGDWGWVGIRDWRVFGLTAETVERVGWWDEAFVPCYCEDADFERRCTLAGVRWGFIEGETSHVGSAVIKGDHRYARANARSYPANVRYFCEKWGVSGVRGNGGHAAPFDGARPADAPPPLSRLRDLSWT
jgi:hypothetical protein